MLDTSYVKGFIESIFPTREVHIEGCNKNLSEWMQWYNGRTSWHVHKVIRNNEWQMAERYASHFAKMVCEEWASNYANEDTTISIEDEKSNIILQDILSKNKFFANFGKFVEKFFALGIGATVVMPMSLPFDENGKIIQNKNNGVKISFLDANRIIPITVDDGIVTECAVVRYATNKCTLQVHLLDENNNYIIAECEGSTDANKYSFNYQKAKIFRTNQSTPLFQIWYPNITDNLDIDNQLGISCLANSIDWLKTFDTIFDGFMTEFKNGRKKRFISTKYLYIDEKGNARNVPLEEDDIYIPDSDMGESKINEFNGELRVGSYEEGLTMCANIIGKQAGLGDNKFSFNASLGRPISTATGIIAREVATYRNIIKNENFATDRIRELVLAIQYVYNTFVEDAIKCNINDIKVTYEDNILEDTSSKKEQELKEVTAGVMSVAEYRSHWYGESEETALEFLQENGMLINSYLSALQSGAITPEMYIKYAFGDDVENKAELVEYIKKQISSSSEDLPMYQDEADE